MVYDHVIDPPDLPEGWVTRFIQPGDEEGILRVMTEAFERWPKLPCAVSPIDHLRWKLASHPIAENFHVVVDSPEGIVGARLDWGLKTMVGKREYDVRMSIDRAVRPKCRKNYAMSAMRNYRQDLHDVSFDMYLGYSSDAPGLENLQKYSARGVTRYRRLIDVLVCDVPTSAPIAEPVAWHLVRAEAFDQRADALWARVRSQFLYGVVRSSAHLSWRYGDRRAGDYVILAAEQDDLWLGYIVVRSSETTGYVADMIGLPERLDVLNSLLCAALEHLGASGVLRVECWSEPFGMYRWALDKAGFREPRRSIGLSFRPLRFPAEEAAFLDDPAASVLFSAGDTDLV